MALFKRKHIQKILHGEKTQTRRTHKRTWKIGEVYALRDQWFRKPQGYILITRKFRQRLDEIMLEEVKKEGHNSLKEFRSAWEEIHGKGSWDPEQTVTVYEFEYVKRNA